MTPNKSKESGAKSVSMTLFRGAVLGLAGFGAGLPGCSTVAVHSAPDVVPAPYAGTHRAVKQTKRAWTHYRYYGEVMFVWWDIPLSAVADTVLLPVDLARQAAGGAAADTAVKDPSIGY